MTITAYPITGYTESQAMTDARRERLKAWKEQREICNQIVAEVSPMMKNLLYSVASVFTMTEEEMNIENWLADTVVYPSIVHQTADHVKVIPHQFGSVRFEKPVDVSKFTGTTAAASKEWCRRHLNDGSY